MTRFLQALFVLSGSLLFAGCHGARPANLGVRDGRLSPCPSTPNCVSSLEPDGNRRLAPFAFSGPAAAAMGRLTELVRSRPRTTVIVASGTYLHAECASAVFRFVDDLEFFADERAGLIHFRSASRVGASDLGVNKRRIETLREIWTAQPR